MERLTNRNDYGRAYYPHCFKENTCGGFGSSEKCDDCDFCISVCEKIAEYEDLEEQGRLIKLPITIENVINNYILEFQLISLWKGIEKGGVITRKRIWFGLPRNIQKELKSCKFKKILGNYMENIENKDVINIEVTMSEESEKELAKMGCE